MIGSLLLALVLVVLVVALGASLTYLRRVRRQRETQRVILRYLTEVEQRRQAWEPVEGDHIRPPRQRFAGKVYKARP